MPALPAHASPALQPVTPPNNPLDNHDAEVLHHAPSDPPPGLISPSFTPPSTPGSVTPAPERDAASISIDTTDHLPNPRLLQTLPKVNCVVRACIPTVTGQEMFLHLYENDIDNKEHLAIVFGNSIRSRSLDAPRPGETEMARMTRGAYTGRLYPGRMNSGMTNNAGKASPLEKSIHKRELSHTSTSVSTPSEISNTPRALDTELNHTQPHSHPSPSHHSPLSPREKPQHVLPLVRIHSECYTGETVWSARCDCGEQLDEAARLMSLPQSAKAGGVIIYLRQEGRGIGLGEKLKAYNLQDLGNDTVEANLLLRHPADARSYGLATSMLVDLGLGRDGADGEGAGGIRLLTNNPEKIRAVEGPNREVVVKERVAMVPLSWKGGKAGIDSKELNGYMRTKIERMGHMLQMGS